MEKTKNRVVSYKRVRELAKTIREKANLLEWNEEWHIVYDVGINDFYMIYDKREYAPTYQIY
ncbi:MAG: hypothetical protein ACK4YO_03210, partial [Candidatus Altarchaeaceae archaeon]